MKDGYGLVSGGIMNLLVVDDERCQLKPILEDEGYHVQCINGENAVEHLKEHAYDGVISHGLASGIDSFKLLQELMHDPQLNTIPVIIVTDTVNDHDKEFALQIGADLYVEISEFSDTDTGSTLKKILTSEKNPPVPMGELEFLKKYSHTLKNAVNAQNEIIQKMHKKLSQSKIQYKKLFEGAHDATFILDTEGTHVKVNKKASQLLGYTQKELKGLSFRNIVVPSAIPDSKSKLKILLQGGDIPVYEKKFRTKKGDIIPVEISVSGITDESGNVQYIQSIVRNITERKKAEEKLKESEEKFRTLVEQAAVGIAIIQDSVLTYVNSWFADMTGYGIHELVGNPVTTYIKCDQPSWLKGDNNLHEGTIQKKDGHTVYIEFNCGPTTFKGKSALLLIVRDITEHKAAEVALYQSEKQYQNLFENAPIGIYRTTPDGKILMANPTLVRLLGYSSYEKLAQRNLEEEGYETGYPRKVFKEYMDRDGEIIGLESGWTRKDGTTVFLRENARAVRDSNGTILYYEGTVEDITARRKAEEKIQKSEEWFRALVQNSLDVVYVLNNEEIIQYVSPNVNQVMGYVEPQGTESLQVLDFVHPQDVPIVQKALNELRKNPGKTIVYEFRIRDNWGQYLWMEVWGKNMLETPAVSGIVLNVRNITERKKAEEKLKESEERYRSIVELAPDGIITFDLKGVVTSVNSAFLKISGYTKDNIVGKHMSKIPTIRWRDIPRYIQLFSNLIQGKIDKPFEFSWIRKDGTERQGEAHIALMKRDGKTVGLQSIVRDITERKKAEEMLRLSEEKYRTLVENLSVGVYRVTPGKKGKFIDVNQAFALMLGYEKEEILQLHARDIYVNPDNRDAFSKKMIDKKFIKNEELQLKRKDGTTIIASDTARAVYENGDLVYFDGVAEDITQRKQVERELKKYRQHLEELVEERTTKLREANEKLQQEIQERLLAEESLAAEKEQLAVTLRSIGDGVITADMEGTVVLVNKVAEKLTGWSQEEASGRDLNEIFATADERTGTPCENPVEKVLSSGTVVGLGNNTMLIAKDGTERIIADSGAPIRDRNSRIVGVVLVFRDITEKRKMEQELLRAQKLESLGILAGGIAHDFNNILTAVLNNVTLAKINAQDTTIETKLTKIEKASLQAKNLTHQLLTFSKGGTPIKKVTSITDLIEESASFALRGSNVRCHFYIADTVWPVDIDEGQISQVINNVIINADQAMPEGGIIQVRVGNAVVNSDDTVPIPQGHYIKISITDEGVGIPKNHLSKIFDPYFSTKQKGSGLGLATSYSIVKRHNGLIDVESQVGVGTTFHIWLPASVKEWKKQKDTQDISITREAKILLMDDEENILDAAGEVLAYLGYTVAFARDGADAISLYEKARQKGEPFDVVIMDLTVPGGMGGEETIQKLLSIDPGVCAIVSSGYSNDPVMADYQKYGFKGVITKPYTVEELNETLQQVME
ncbi:MAG: PAS domain S-box protein [Candidatus Methanofastidiosia archaeon]|jgi:PAS domain S-box-containing protein